MATQTLCGLISAGIAIDCDNLPQSGTADRVILFNSSDVDKAATTYDATTTTQIESLTMVLTKTGYAVGGMNNSIEPQQSQVNEGFLPTYIHEVKFIAFATDQIVRDNVEKLAKGRYMAIVETLGQDFEVYGFAIGMTCVECTRVGNDGETGGAYVVTLRTPENGSKEPKLPQILLASGGTYTATLALVDALI